MSQAGRTRTAGWRDRLRGGRRSARRFTRKLWLPAVAALVAALAVPGAAPAMDNPDAQFEQFCGEWMEKLAARERDNKKHIQWVPNGSGVAGEYVGYSTEHECHVKPHDNPGAVPVGKIIYRELRYQKSGPSPAEAENATPQAVDATEVTEIFRYSKGKWEY